MLSNAKFEQETVKLWSLDKGRKYQCFSWQSCKLFGAFRWRYTGAINALDAMLIFVRLGLLLARNPRCLSNPISITLCAIPKEFFKFASNGFLRYRRQTGNAYACAWLTNPFYKIVADLHVKFRIVTRLVGLFSNTRHHRAPGRIYIELKVLTTNFGRQKSFRNENNMCN